jgi:predicted nuclease of predicted toxin-antitoxin system
MKLLSDQDVFGTTIRLVRGAGHDVVTAAALGLAQTEDVELLRVAQGAGRVLLTRDRDFGHLVFMAGSGGGVIYLRMLPENQHLVHAELETVLASYSQEELLAAFIVVEPGRHRIRRLPAT